MIKKIILLISFVVLSGFYSPFIVRAESLSDLQRQQNELNKQIQENRKALSQKKIDVTNLQNAVASLESQITAMQRDIDLSTNKINVTNQQIDKLRAEITKKEEELVYQKEKLYEAMRVMYETPQQSTVEIIVGSNSISEVVDRAQYIESVEYSIETTINEIYRLKTELESQRNQLEKQKSDLESQKAALVSKQQDFKSQQNLKNDLLNNAQGTLANLRSQQEEAQVRIAEVNQKIQVLTGRSNWGSQIISDAPTNWYFTQRGNYTTLGNSPYTVNDFGCLVTSYAMVATYYGRRTTPTEIAQQGYFYYGNFNNNVSDFGIVMVNSDPVNWTVVDDELSNGYPVIISLLLAGATGINGDGSSHFVVLSGKSGDKYLMQDPLGTGRSYDLSQVRSMKIIRPI